MTLVAAWRNGAGIHLASDSRVTSGASTADVGIKVCSSTLCFFDPATPNKDPMPKFERRIGIGIIGDFLTASSVRDSVQSVIEAAPFIPDVTDISFGGIATFLGDFLRDLGGQISAMRSTRCTLIVVGGCLVTRRPRAFELIYDSNGTPNTTVKEILMAHDRLFYGSGARKARAVNIDDLDPIQIVKLVVDDPTIGSVGGPVQYGRLGPSGQCRIFSVRDYFVDHVQRTVHAGIYRGGVELYDGPIAGADDSIIPMQTFVDPFEDKINALLDARYTVV